MPKPSATAQRGKARQFRTLEELAEAVERDKGTISRWTKREDWPFARKAPWPASDKPKILRWVADTLEKETTGGAGAKADGGKPDEQKRLKLEKLKEEIRKLRAQADQAETALKRERGALMDAAEVESEWASIGVAVRNDFANLPSQLVPLALSHGMPHEAAATFQDQVQEAVNAILRRLSSDPQTEDSESGEDEVPAGDLPAGEVDAGRVG